MRGMKSELGFEVRECSRSGVDLLVCKVNVAKLRFSNRELTRVVVFATDEVSEYRTAVRDRERRGNLL
jgi:intracellular sulfur oxidation DsrE/DsrF family protein